MSSERQLVTLEPILDVRPIADADAIEAVVVRGWLVVTKKGDFAVGDRCVYFEIDSALPLADPRFEFLGARGTKTLGDGTQVHVLKTARLRGTYSQGLVMPVMMFPELASASADSDLAAIIGVTKYEPVLPASMNGFAIGDFPTVLARKTDAERAQNLVDVWPILVAAGPWIATEKLDGTSVTVINDGGLIRVCGRNWELADGDNVYWEVVRAAAVDVHLQPGEVVQAEIYGEGVQGNPLKVRGRHLGVFAFNSARRAVALDAWPAWLAPLAVPVYPAMSLPATAEQAVAQVDTLASMVNPSRNAEGIVWVRANGAAMPELDGRNLFKVISNRYLLKHG